MRLQSAAIISIETLSLARTQEDQHECAAAQRAAQKEPDASHIQLCMSISKYNSNTIDSRLWIFSDYILLLFDLYTNDLYVEFHKGS